MDEQRNYSVTFPIEESITDAVARHLIEEYSEGHVVTGWLLLGESVDQEGNQEPIVLSSENLSWVMTLGLLEAGKLMLQADFRTTEE